MGRPRVKGVFRISDPETFVIVHILHYLGFQMPRVDAFNELPGKLSVHVYADHMPPHFHVRSPNTNAKIDIETLQLIRGKIDAGDLVTVVAWASKRKNRRRLRELWRSCNECG